MNAVLYCELINWFDDYEIDLIECLNDFDQDEISCEEFFSSIDYIINQ